MLYIIGIGLSDEKDITVKGLEAVKKCGKVYLESYTSKLQCEVSDLENLYSKRIVLADRDIVEKKAEDTILKDAKAGDTAFLVIGDALSATTHLDLITRAKELGIKTKVIQNATVLNAVAVTGLQLYKFGKTTSIPFPQKNFKVEAPYDIIKQNKSIDAHTLVLLDLKPSENRYMTAAEAAALLLEIEKRRKEKVFTEDTMCIACSMLASDKQKIVYEKAEDMSKKDIEGAPQCLIVPAKLHFTEEESLQGL